MDIQFNNHYIVIDSASNIVDGFSDAFITPQPTDILINAEGGYQFRLFPGGEANPLLLNEYGVPLYFWDGKKAQERTPKDIEADTPTPILPTPTLEERVTAFEDAIIEISSAGDYQMTKFRAIQVRMGNSKLEDFPARQRRDIESEVMKHA